MWRASEGGKSGTVTTPVIGEHAPLNWPHPFTLDRIDLHGAVALEGVVQAPEVLFVQSGTMTVTWADGELTLAAGDTMTVPIGLTRNLTGPCVAYRVSG